MSGDQSHFCWAVSHIHCSADIADRLLRWQQLLAPDCLMYELSASYLLVLCRNITPCHAKLRAAEEVLGQPLCFRCCKASTAKDNV